RAGAGRAGHAGVGRLRAGRRHVPRADRPGALHRRRRRGAEVARRARAPAALRPRQAPGAVRRARGLPAGEGPGREAIGRGSRREAARGVSYDCVREALMSDRIAVLAMAILTAAVVVLAPWGAVNRETGARSAVVLLPQRYVDFTGRTAAVDFPAGNVVLGVTALGVLLAAGGALAGGRARHGLWLAAAVALIGVTTWGLGRLGGAVDDARAAAVRAEVERAAASPTARQDPDVLREALAAFDERSLQENLAAARAGGLNIRRLPYTNVGPGLSAFLAIVLGLVTAVAGLRAWERLRRGIDVFLRGGAVPALSILLAVGAAAVVILLLRPTPVGSGVELSAFERLVGRLDTLWYAYYTMFHDALGTVGGFAESLKLMTPLVFTG